MVLPQRSGHTNDTTRHNNVIESLLLASLQQAKLPVCDVHPLTSREPACHPPARAATAAPLRFESSKQCVCECPCWLQKALATYPAWSNPSFGGAAVSLTASAACAHPMQHSLTRPCSHHSSDSHKHPLLYLYPDKTDPCIIFILSTRLLPFTNHGGGMQPPRRPPPPCPRSLEPLERCSGF